MVAKKEGLIHTIFRLLVVVLIWHPVVINNFSKRVEVHLILLQLMKNIYKKKQYYFYSTLGMNNNEAVKNGFLLTLQHLPFNRIF